MKKGSDHSGPMYFLGILAFIASAYSVIFLKYSLNLHITIDKPVEAIASLLLFSIIIMVFYKLSKYFALGFLLSLPAILLFIAIFIVEMWMHPPDEE